MAVARCEFGMHELDWLVATLDCARGRPVDVPVMTPKEQERVVRELRRAQRAVHESHDREVAHMRRVKAGYRTAPDKDTEVLDHGQRHGVARMPAPDEDWAR